MAADGSLYGAARLEAYAEEQRALFVRAEAVGAHAVRRKHQVAMWQVKLVVDFNGIVLFDPGVVTQLLGKVRKGTNLFHRFTRTDEGDQVLAAGLFVPVLAIDDSVYDIYVRFDSEQSRVRDDWVVCENGTFALKIADSLVIADLEALQSWNGPGDGNRLQFSRGTYAVDVRGFSSPKLETAGYEFILRRCGRIPKVTAPTNAKMRVLRV